MLVAKIARDVIVLNGGIGPHQILHFPNALHSSIVSTHTDLTPIYKSVKKLSTKLELLPRLTLPNSSCYVQDLGYL